MKQIAGRKIKRIPRAVGNIGSVKKTREVKEESFGRSYTNRSNNIVTSIVEEHFMTDEFKEIYIYKCLHCLLPLSANTYHKKVSPTIRLSPGESYAYTCHHCSSPNIF